MAKQLLFEDHARARMMAGVDKLANAVAVTMGPTGRNVIIDKSFGGPTVTKDGVTVAKEIELEDRFENMGAKLVIEVAQKTSDLAGDGTTTATVLARAIFKEGLRNIVAGSNPAAIRRGIEKAVAAASDKLVEMGRPVKDKQEVAHVGAISANNDNEIGELLADALERVGKDGVITVEEGKSRDTEVEVRRRDAVRQGLHFALLHHRSRHDGSESRKRFGAAVRKEDQQHSRSRAVAGKDCTNRSAAVDHRRRR